MSNYILFWTIIIAMSLISFIYMSFRVLTKGLPELREMFKQLNDTKSNHSHEETDLKN